MKNLIRHFWENNREEVVSKSLLNCHVPGVHSVMLLDRPGQRIRLYYADGFHTLWKNANPDSGIPMSIGYHQHHCDISLEVILGSVKNHTVEVVGEHHRCFDPKELGAWKWQSPILGGNGKFDLIDRRRVMIHRPTTHTPGQDPVLHLRANEFHTVSVRPMNSAAWLVYEGPEWSEYEPITLTNTDLSKESSTHLYRPADASEVRSILQLATRERLDL